MKTNNKTTAMNKIINNKKQINVSQILVQILVICIIVLSSIYFDDSERQVINVLGFLIAFFASIYMHKFFFPFILLSVTAYLLAGTQELYNTSYIYLPITKILWTIGNVSLPIGILHFIYKLLFKFKIVERDNENSN